MSKRLTKLSSRARRPVPQKTLISSSPRLNNSDEDFQSVIKTKSEHSVLKNSQCSSTHQKEDSEISLKSDACDEIIRKSASKSDFLQPCPFCGKTFNEGQDLSRVSHFKICGNQLGVGVTDLLKIKKLQERQAEEWKALNLPKASANVSKHVTINRSTTNNRSKLTRNNVPQLDANFELALAMSASLAEAEKFFSKNSEEQSSKKKLEVVEAPEEASKSWWQHHPPTIAAKNCKRFKSKAKTTLQVRTENDRSQQISEQVASILYSEADVTNRPPDLFGLKNYNFFDKLQSKLLITLQCQECRLWNGAALTAGGGNFPFFIENFCQYLTRAKKVTKKSESEKRENEFVEQVSTDSLISDWEKVFESGEKCDLTIFTRGEEKIRVHSLVLWVRNRKILSEVIEENEKTKILSWDDISKKVAKQFLLYLYTNKLPERIDNGTDFKDMKLLAKKYPIFQDWKDFVKSFDGQDFPEVFDFDEQQNDVSTGKTRLKILPVLIHEPLHY
jgi:hypothetical protein